MNLDFIKDPRFGIGPLSEAIINYPNEYGLLNSMGLFSGVSISETTVKIDIKNKQINIIPTTPRGAPAPRDTSDTRSMKVLPTFRHALGFSLLADEFQNVRKFGTDGESEVFDERLMEKLEDNAAKHRQTREFLRWGALKGNVYDADGTTVLYNVYDEMGETQVSIDFKLGSALGTDGIQDGTDALLDHLETNSNGEPINGVAKICSPGYWTKLMKNADFKEAFKHFDGAPNPNRNNLRGGFFFKGVYYFRHNGSATFLAADGTKTTHNFVPANEAIAVPLGTRQVFRTYYAPADYIETVNTLGQEMYAKLKVMDLDKGIEGETQCQALDLVLKPRLVVKCTTST